jgi:hypothetical protein
MMSIGGLQRNASLRIKITRRAEYGRIPLPNATEDIPTKVSTVEISVGSPQEKSILQRAYFYSLMMSSPRTQLKITRTFIESDGSQVNHLTKRCFVRQRQSSAAINESGSLEYQQGPFANQPTIVAPRSKLMNRNPKFRTNATASIVAQYLGAAEGPQINAQIPPNVRTLSGVIRREKAEKQREFHRRITADRGLTLLTGDRRKRAYYLHPLTHTEE